MKHERYSIRISSSPSALAGIKRFINRVANLHAIPSAVRDDLALAVYEGCANVIEHAYDNSEGGKLEVEVEIKDRVAIIFIYDNGPPFTPPSNTPCARELIDEGADGGLGLWMIRNLMGEVNFYRQDGVNVLEMRKDLDPRKD
ncbi:ATP-binding protein [bacterium]|nr:ATP-binding protein [bacterium]